MIKERVKGLAGFLPRKEGNLNLAPEPDFQADEEEGLSKLSADTSRVFCSDPEGIGTKA